MNQPFNHIKTSRFTALAKPLRLLRLLVYLVAIPAFSFSQMQNIKFEYLGIESGLSYNNVFCLLQDSRGFMWFGTSDGLNKYDGYQYTVYKYKTNNPYSINSNSIKCIVEDSKAVVWVGTWGGGLNQFDREKDRFIHFKHNPTDENSISSDFVTSLLEDKQGNLWIGTENGGLDLFDRKNNRFIHFSQGAGNKTLGNFFITSIFEDSRNNLWIGTISGGLNLFDPATKIFKKFNHNDQDRVNNRCSQLQEVWNNPLGCSQSTVLTRLQPTRLKST